MDDRGVGKLALAHDVRRPTLDMTTPVKTFALGSLPHASDADLRLDTNHE